MTKNDKKWKILIFSDELLYTSGSAWRAFLGALKAQKSPKMIPTSFKGCRDHFDFLGFLISMIELSKHFQMYIAAPLKKAYFLFLIFFYVFLWFFKIFLENLFLVLGVLFNYIWDISAHAHNTPAFHARNSYGTIKC